MTLDRHRRVVVLVAALLVILVTARLGLWQLDRAQQKIDRQLSLEQRSLLPDLPAAALARTPAEALAQHNRQVTLQGRWLSTHTVYLDNRQMNGRSGFFVVSPLLLPDGAAVLVQRGWLPRNFEDRTRLPPIDTPSGLVRVRGRLAPPPGKLFEFAGASTGPIRQNLALDDFSREIRVVLRPVSLVQTEVEQPLEAALPVAAAASSGGLLRQWSAPAADVGKHHGYAFQWFALCALTAGLTVWFQFIRPRVQVRQQHPD